MDLKAFKDRVAHLTMEELKRGVLSWYYCSMAGPRATVGFQGGFLVRALGEVHATSIIHTMGWYVQGCETMFIPMTDEDMAKVPEEQRWRKLTREEAKNLA